MRKWLSGRKAYLCGTGLIIAGIVEYIDTGDIGNAIKLILEGLGIMGLRAGMAKIKK